MLTENAVISDIKRQKTKDKKQKTKDKKQKTKDRIYRELIFFSN
jgi:L-cysteine desulfidase